MGGSKAVLNGRGPRPERIDEERSEATGLASTKSVKLVRLAPKALRVWRGEPPFQVTGMAYPTETRRPAQMPAGEVRDRGA